MYKTLIWVTSILLILVTQHSCENVSVSYVVLYFVVGKCTFPFQYLGVKYYTCITKDTSWAWCAKTANYDSDKEWGYCIIYAGMLS